MNQDKLLALAEEYLTLDPNQATREEIQKDVEARNFDALAEKLDERLEFGTAGLRGPMGAGYSRMNDLVVIQTTQGVCKYLLKTIGDEAKSRGIAIGFDHRSQAGCQSSQFAKYIAAVCIESGFKVYLYSKTVATPFVPWCIEQKQCAAGVMVTASHNPKMDNGYKLYWGNGAQIIPPHDAAIAEAILDNLTPWKTYDLASITYSHDLVSDPSDLIDAYFEALSARLCCNREINQSSDLKITYTAMHGVGLPYAEKAFRAFGHKPFIRTETQVQPDANFPTVAFPNPEEGKGALRLACQTADEHGSTLVLANDPDADRLAVAEKQADGEWRVFTGNELGALLGHWMWVCYHEQHPGVAPGDVYVLFSTVSSHFLKEIARKEKFNAEDTLTGFKWMGNRTAELRAQGKHVIFSFEEAIGFCVGDIVKDKDGVSAAAVFSELANVLANQGKSISEHFDYLRDTYGYVTSENSYYICDDKKKIDAIFRGLRNNGEYIETVGPYKVVRVVDITKGYDSESPDKKAIMPATPSSQMITYHFENGARITLRTSGTEPKLKYYSELAGKDMAEIEKVLKEQVDFVVKELLQPVKNGLQSRQT